MLTAGDVLTLPELRHLRRTSTLRGVALVLHAWAVIAGAMLAYALWPSVPLLLLAVAVIGSRQLGLAVLMHEAAHWLLASSPRVDNALGRWWCAYPVGGDLASYRRHHHRHHRVTQRADDPDLDLAAAYPKAPAEFWRDTLADLGGLTTCRRLLDARWWRQPRPAAWWRGTLVTNALLAGGLAALGQWHLYVLLWLLPLATWYRAVARLRNATEHALVTDPADPLRNSRTTHAGLLARIFLAPYWVNHHVEHHLLVFVPCWKLRQAHVLLTRAHGERMEMAAGYRELIRRMTARA